MPALGRCVGTGYTIRDTEVVLACGFGRIPKDTERTVGQGVHAGASSSAEGL